MNVIHLLCASTSVHIFCMLKNVSVLPRLNVDARRTSHQRQSNVRHKYTTCSKFVANAFDAYSGIKSYNANVDDYSSFYRFVLHICNH